MFVLFNLVFHSFKIFTGLKSLRNSVQIQFFENATLHLTKSSKEKLHIQSGHVLMNVLGYYKFEITEYLHVMA